ncbi:MAG: WYL domain-containing protein [Acidimicrobiia bacterium]|nr:WYL domain-containing protein [Acidimicrobiia bacterium]
MSLPIWIRVSSRTSVVLDLWQAVRVSTSGGRLLRLLTLLGSRAWWTGEDLADRLEVTTRTVRRDIDRLRELGYPIEALSGPGGGYGFGRGGRLPPLLLEDDEAVAMAVGLRTAGAAAVTGAAEAATRASVKLEQVLPPALAAQVDAITKSMVLVGSRGEEIDSSLLAVLAGTCRKGHRLRLEYKARNGVETERLVDPFRLVHIRERWYLVAHDITKGEWRTFRVDRVLKAVDTARKAEYPDPPDAVELVQLSVSTLPYRYQAVIRFDTPPETLSARIPPGYGLVEADGPEASVFRIGSNYLDGLVSHVIGLGFDFTILEPPELIPEVQRAIDRLSRSIADQS